MPQPQSHQLHIQLIATGITQSITDFTMPSWMPGYYQLLNYAGKVSGFAATDNNHQPLSWEKTGHSTWRVIHSAGSAIHLEYDVNASTNFVAQPWLDSTHAYIAPTGVFLYPAGYLQSAVSLTVQPAAQWPNIATGLAKTNTNTFHANNFDILYDSPILIGQLESTPSFTVKGIPHYFTGWRIGNFDKQQLSNDLQKMITSAANIIGEIPYPHYTFLAIGPGRGGIEHLNSTTISFSGEHLNTPEGREQMLSFMAHEYFHHYNVKRIRPVALGPFDYTRENITNMLWVSEGLTVYYEYIVLRRAGLMTTESLLQNLQHNIAAYENTSGRLYQSLTQASAETWHDGPFGRSPDSTISYYQKGPAMGMLLDFAIRNATNNNKSLDDVMRTLYYRFYKEKQRGFTDKEFQQVCEATAGIKLDEFFEYIYTVKTPDYTKYLGYGGIAIDLQTTSSNKKIYSLSFIREVTPLQEAIRKSWQGL
ncbi:M61 family metallopeptidase [Filimonas lacunae]|nr:M61 family metallopeptidase [Filimonas lacunae]BAV08650.1 hypothetical protein FLA_4697 [Filimonas lacunae]